MELGLLVNGIIMLAIAALAAVGLIIYMVGSVKEEKRSGFTKMGGVVAVVLGLLFFMMNTSGSSEITSEVEGTYKVQYPGGQVEVLFIKNDRSFEQGIYSNVANYHSNNALFRNKGTWAISQNQLEFNHWMTICHLARNTDSILLNPEILTLTQIHWQEATSRYPALIDIWPENGYVLMKIGRSTASK